MSGELTFEQRERLESIFDRASELPLADQTVFLDKECGTNGPLREHLARLLAGLAGENLLGEAQAPPPSRAGTQVGPYRLLERIGEGGMGEVYAADQREPIVQRVALKIIKPGMDSTQVVARFEAERQALARMSHPNIAQVFDGGTTPSGSPYFVMEYVAGVPITDYCDQHKLSTRARLELFLDVCEGVQHAHQKGIIHRDLKPSNILVTEQDGRALPKIIDFGVARAVTGRLVDRTLHTMMGQIVGTLDYMSPEQADPSSTDVDTRSDIYSMGVVLYQVLSGLLPFEYHLATDLPLSEIQRSIRETDPPTPSTRLKRERKTATRLAPLHGTDERSLLRQLTGDLDWICLKALEKDPARRYASASELAEDLRRHLRHEPVLAGRPGTLYRARKFVRRNRLGVTSAALLILALGGAAFGLVHQVAGARVEAAFSALSELRRAERLVDRADELWPAYADRLPELQQWKAEADEIVSHREEYRRELEALESRALPWTDAEQRSDPEIAPDSARLKQLKAWVDGRKKKLDRNLNPDLPPRLRLRCEAQLQVFEREMPLLEPRVSARQTYDFESMDDKWRHAWMRDLVDILDTLVDERSGLDSSESFSPDHGYCVAWRIDRAREMEFAESDPNTAPRWREAHDEILASERYYGLELKPQKGLLPLGPDPTSGLWEFYVVQSGSEPVRDPETGGWMLEEGSGIVLVLLPQGSYWMGSQRGNPKGQYYVSNPTIGETLFHVDSVPAFFLSKFEMTRAQWERIGGPARGSGFPGDEPPGPLFPIDMVSWTECDQAMRRLGLELPSEVQWEYAARAGTTTPWWTGVEDKSLQGAANVFDLTSFAAFPQYGESMSLDKADWEDGEARMGPVGRTANGEIRRPNLFGFHDVLGNAIEWCSNLAYEYGTEPGSDPDVPVARVARGGSARQGPKLCRSGARFTNSPEFRFPALGLRPSREIDR
ncbi:MAG: protein kinase [Planctomycetes bacterium]|nr:protein kinase [Planctomycetota bacterium]